MSEKKKAYIVISIALSLLLIIIFIFIWQLNEENKIVNKIKNIKNNSTSEIIYLTRPSCSYCNLLEPITESLKKEYNLNYNIINIDEISNMQLKKILKELKINEKTFGTPYLTIVKDNKIIDSYNGFADENILFNFFQKNNIISNNEKLILNYIDINSIYDILNQKDDLIILLGKIGNENVINAKEKLKSIVKKYNVNISYLDVSLLDNEELKQLLNKLNYTEELNIPTLLIIEKGKIKAIETDISNYENLFN